jgi:hypothetical protein
MKKILPLMALLFVFSSCEKDEIKNANEHTECPDPFQCDIVQTYINNAAKATVSNGIWGTVSSMEGNCMPMVGPGSTCSHCPVKRTVKIYAYTITANAVASSGNQIGFYDSFNTQLIKQVDTDNEGFFQTDLPAGKYTLVVVENGKLFGSTITDGQTGINPFTYTSGAERIDFKMMYKAVF